MENQTETYSLLQIAGKRKGLLIIASFFSVISGILQLIPFVAVYKIVESFFLQAQNQQAVAAQAIQYWGLIALIGLIASLLMVYVGTMCSHIAAFNILYEMRVILSEHVAKVPMGYHTKTATGELKKIIESSVEKIEKFIAHQLPDLITAIAVPILLIGYLFYLDWRLALVAFLILVLAFLLQSMVYGNEAGKNAYRDFQFAVEEMNATGVEYIRGIPAVKVFGVSAASFLTFKQAVTKYRDISLKITNVYKVPYITFEVVITSIFAFILPLGIYILSKNPENLVFAITFILFLIVTPSLASPLMKLMYLGGGLREITEGNKRINEVLNEPLIQEPTHPQKPTSYGITFDHVSFAYEDQTSKDYKEVLHDISFSAKVAEITALVGPSGGGKSTITSLLLRFWDIQSGEIRIGGIPLQEIGTENLMNMTSFVFQDVHLFYDTMEENIRMGNQKASKEEVIAAAKVACCHEFIEKLPQGYDTKIGGEGVYLSGGEAQRIAIARALLKNSPILVLDEATAYADAENERNIQKGLAELVKGKTVLIVAHRLSTIQGAAKILVIKQGKIVESGTHVTLRNEAGLYEQMWQAHMNATSWQLEGRHVKKEVSK